MAGCELAEQSDKRLKMRMDGMAFTLNAAADSEASRPKKFTDGTAWAIKDAQASGRRLAANTYNAWTLLEYDVNRFCVRNPPLYKKKATEVLWGKPQNVGPHGIILFW